MKFDPKISAAKSVPAPKKRGWSEYLFCLLVGSMYVYALNRVIISSTLIRVTQLRLFTVGVVTLALFVLIFYNRITRIVSVAIIVFGALIVFFTLERWESQVAHFYDLFLMVRGYIHYRPELGMTVLWMVSLLLSLVAVIFMLYRFSFYVLSLTGVVIFLFTWGPGFTRDPTSFLIFLLCFCLLLIRKINQGVAAVYVAAPICAALVLFIQVSVPTEAELFQRRTLQELFDGPLAAVSDFIYTLTNPMYFSFQSTGFTGQGGRLGGPVTPNARNVMTVKAPGRTYLAGATSNTYTGYRWHSTLEHGQLYTQGMAPGRFEMLETAAAIIRMASHNDGRHTVPQSLLWSLFPVEDHRHLSPRHFPVLGLDDVRTNQYLHSYLPIDQVTVAIGTNRTGTVFRPLNARQLWFHAAGPNYFPSLVFDPIGDVRAPTFMARNTQYHMNFLNVNHRLSFVEALLNESRPGLYETRETTIRFNVANNVWQIAHDDGAYYMMETYEVEIPIEAFTADLTFWVNYLAPENVTLNTSMYETLMQAAADMRGALDGTVTANCINDIFELYAYIGPNRELRYFHSYSRLMAMLDAFSRDVLARYAETVREHFMYVPEIVPDRVHDLVAEIIYGLDTDFERVMAIRDYLIQFPYTLSPQPVPYGVCFVDHFLFEGQEGYCTYYASAMAIMSRIAGVPSRYVEGFLLPPAPPAESDVAIFVVTNMMAHAWVEVYLEGFGWLIVEATAPYAFFIDPTLPLPPGGMNPGWFDDEWWRYMEEDFFAGDGGYWEGFIPGARPADVSEGGTQTALNMPSFNQVRNFSLIVVVVAAAAVIVFLVAQFIRVITMAGRIRRLPVNRQIIAYFKGILDITSHCTSAKDPAETPYVYGQRVGRRFAFKSDSVLLRDLVTLYYKARYGNKELSEQERELMEDSYFDMVRYLQRENRRTSFFYLRYIRRIGTIYN